MRKLLFTLLLFIGITAQAQEFNFNCPIDIPASDWLEVDGIRVFVNGPSLPENFDTMYNLRAGDHFGLVRIFYVGMCWTNSQGTYLCNDAVEYTFKTNLNAGKTYELTAGPGNAFSLIQQYSVEANPANFNFLEE